MTKLFAVAMSATEETRQTLEIPSAIDDTKIMQIADVTYHGTKAGFVIAEDYREAGDRAIEMAKDILPTSEGWGNHRVHVLAIESVLAKEAQNNVH